MTTFTERVLQIVRAIEKGKVMTYKEVAILASKSMAQIGGGAAARTGDGAIARSEGGAAARAVGTIMKNNYDTTVPCHRVVRSDGHIGDYNRGGRAKKIELLKSEGVEIVKDFCVRL